MKGFDPTDFAMLQGQKWHARIRAAAQEAGVTLPYFRMHEASAGPQTSIDSRSLINFSSYDYLGLNDHPAVRNAAIRAVEQHGTSVSASRLVAGERPFHRSLEAALAQVHGVDAALAMVSGHATNVTAVGHLLAPPDLLVHDGSIHNSVVMGGRQSGATVLKFDHNDLSHLERLLSAHRTQHRRCLIVVEGLYSMEGDVPDLPQLIALKRRHAAWLMVDEAHALGVLGRSGRGSVEHHGIAGCDVDIWMGTLSKALASTGGYIAGSSELIDYLKHSAPGFVFSVGLSAPAAAAAEAALGVMLAEPDRLARLRQRSMAFRDGARALGLDTGSSIGAGIVPLLMGDSLRTLVWSDLLYEAGVNVFPILFPAVAYDDGLLRFFVSSEHTPEQVAQALSLVARTYADARQVEAPPVMARKRSRLAVP